MHPLRKKKTPDMKQQKSCQVLFLSLRGKKTQKHSNFGKTPLTNASSSSILHKHLTASYFCSLQHMQH